MMNSLENKTLRIGLLGAGAIVKERHLPGILLQENVLTSAVANRSLESSESFCRQFIPTARATGDWRELVNSPDLDIIWIGTHPNLHCEMTLAALDAGKHVFCQARMACNLDEAERMLRASSARSDLVTMLCPPPHGLRYDSFIRHLLKEKIAGEIHAIRVVSRNGAFLDPYAPAHWRQMKEENGLNVLTLGIHVEVLQRWFGRVCTVQASAQTQTRWRGSYEVLLPDALSLDLEFDSGIHAALDLSGISSKVADFIEITGSEGTLRYDYQHETISFARKGKEPEQLSVPPSDDRPWQVESDFINAVRRPDAPRPHPSFENGVAYMRVVQAVHQSLELNSKVTIENIPN